MEHGDFSSYNNHEKVIVFHYEKDIKVTPAVWQLLRAITHQYGGI